MPGCFPRPCHPARSETLPKPMAQAVEGLLSAFPNLVIPCAPEAREESAVCMQRPNSCRDSRPRLSAERSDAQQVWNGHSCPLPLTLILMLTLTSKWVPHFSRPLREVGDGSRRPSPAHTFSLRRERHLSHNFSLRTRATARVRNLLSSRLNLHPEHAGAQSGSQSSTACEKTNHRLSQPTHS
jgi:hypothetical protein